MKNYFYLAAAALVLAACSNDETEPQRETAVSSTPIALTASVATSAGTRAGVGIQSQAFDENENINVECTPAGGTLKSVVYTAGAPTENKNELTAASGAFTWPADGSNVSLKAYYPSTVGSSTTSFSVEEDQSNNDKYKKSDLMYSNGVNDQAKTADAIGLTFTHALSKIVVNLTAGTGVSADDITNSTVTLKAKKTAAITSGVAGTASEDATITIGKGANNAAIIVPQTISATESAKVAFITITTAGNFSVSYQLAADKTFAAGSVYTYTLKVSMSGITLQSTSITDWDNSGDGKTIDGGTLVL